MLLKTPRLSYFNTPWGKWDVNTSKYIQAKNDHTTASSLMLQYCWDPADGSTYI